MKSKIEKLFLIKLPLTVKTYDIDFAGIVSNIVYVRWLEDLRFEMLSRYFPIEDLLEDGFVPVLTSTSIQYIRPIRMQEKVMAKIWMSSLEASKCTLRAEFLVGGKLAASAEQVGLFVSRETGRPRRMPVEIVKKYEAIKKGEEFLT